MAETKDLFTGSCACGRITYACDSLPITTQFCHCVTCQKLSGGAYQAYADVDAKTVSFQDHHEHITCKGWPTDDLKGFIIVRLSKTGERALCASCYSALAMRYKFRTDQIGLTLGTVDEGSVRDGKVREALRPRDHIFASQRAWWVEIGRDGLAVYDRFTGDFEREMHDWESSAVKER